jgi:hypothetical protein
VKSEERECVCEREREREREGERERKRERQKRKYIKERKRERDRWLEGKKSVFLPAGTYVIQIPSRLGQRDLVIFCLQMCLPGRNTNYVPPSEKRDLGGKSCKL